MTRSRSFHALGGSFHYRLGYWTTVRREHEHRHQATFLRRVFYRFKTHTHPYAQRLMTELVTKDIAGLEALDDTAALRVPFFDQRYEPKHVTPELDTNSLGADAVGVYAPVRSDPNKVLPEEGLPVDDLDFDYSEGAYAVYNWELFFHVPFTLAVHLSKNGRYAEARRWFHYIFDPTDSSDPGLGPKRFWKVKPFQTDEVEHIQDTLFNLATEDDPTLQRSTVRAISAWRSNPLRPHLVARTRPTAYMYATVMAYLDNLIAWGDSLFRQDTPESINEATQLYVLAANILGPRPQAIPKRGTIRPQTYNSLRKGLDEFGNAAVKLEADLAFDLFPAPSPVDVKPEQAVIESVGRSLYFCIPRNEKFLGYWDTVGDRLYKIRNSLNLQGVFRQPPLFAPPIDPAMLARAVAAGVDVGAIIDGTADKITPIRFPVLLQRAVEMCQEVKALGGQILAAIEKKDNETLGVLRSQHEKTLLDKAKEVRLSQWKEAIKNREGIERSVENAFQRYRYYERLLGQPDEDIKRLDWAPFVPPAEPDGSGALATEPTEPTMPTRDITVDIAQSPTGGAPDRKLSSHEDRELERLATSQTASDAAGGFEGIASALNLIPSFDADGKFWGIGAGITLGGINVARLFQAMASVSRAFAARFSYEASQATKVGSYVRREQDWAVQANAAAGELNQLYKQLRAAEVREHIAKKEYDNHVSQYSQSEEVYEFLTNEKNLRSGKGRKTTTEDFYLWMKGEAQTLHAQSFQFAHELARKAEKALQWEMGTSTRFIGTHYLAGREGLFAGEKLHLDLKRMEAAYAELNTRDYEITKHISLREWFPLQLMLLRTSGTCTVELPEELFDLDCPGHSYRRIRSVALSIPCVTGPYASVNCSLTLSRGSKIRDASGLIDCDVATMSIVTSSAQGDTGMFETNLRDDRHLPFEGAGVVHSKWDIALLGSARSFDYDTIADVVLTIRYTARGNGLANASAKARDWLKQHAARMFSMRHEFSSEWARFRRIDTASGQRAVLKFDLTEEHFPYLHQLKTDTGPGTGLGQAKQMRIYFAGDPGEDVKLKRAGTTIAELKRPTSSSSFDMPFDATGSFELDFAQNNLDDLWIIVDWSG